MSISILFRYYSQILRYSLEPGRSQFRLLSEQPIVNVNDIYKSVVLETLNVGGFNKLHTNFISMPSPINEDTLKYLFSIPLHVVHEKLKSNQVVGSTLLKYSNQGKTYVTDGTNVNEYQTLYDSRIKYTDLKSSYLLRDPAFQITDKFIPIFILFLIPPVDMSDCKPIFSSDPEIHQMYEKSPFYEVIVELISYFAYFAQPPIYSAKRNFISLILMCFLLGQGKFTIEELSTAIINITFDSDQMYITMQNIAMMRWVPTNGKLGTCSYYCK